MRIVLFLIIIILFLNACKKKEVDIMMPKIDIPPSGLTFSYPSYWPKPIYDLSANTLTNDKFILGRRLFYETKLSRDNTISCGSCHQQEVAFVHSGHDLSHGIDGLFGTRNAPPIFNLAWHPHFMWDGGVNHIEVQPLAPITNPVEMDSNMPEVIGKLSTDNYYRNLFEKAFGSPGISTERIFKALAIFMTVTVSDKSKYDKVMAGTAGVTFTPEEQQGYDIFKAKCAACHQEPLFTDFSFRNNGLPINPTFNDSGRAHITGLPQDRFKFKVPTLRNIELTGPYMHDGRFTKLEQCLDHYSSGVANTENLDTLVAGGIPLTVSEKSKLISFLKTLTDRDFINNPHFKDPN